MRYPSLSGVVVVGLLLSVGIRLPNVEAASPGRLCRPHQVYGVIGEKYRQLGGSSSFLGCPLTDELGTPDGIGRYNHFEGGSIYWTPQTGAHAVWGAIRERWASMGWENSELKYPLSEEIVLSDGVGRYAEFQGGRIYWHPETNTAVALKRRVAGVPLFRLQAVPPPDPPTRRISVTGSMRIVDDENWPETDERKTIGINTQAFVNSTFSTVLRASGCAGDEVRVELTLTGMGLENGAVLIDGYARLFEGTDCGTDDLEDDAEVHLLVPPGRNVFHVIPLDDSAGSARIPLTITNNW
jgi:hypothetical protein